MPHPKSTPSLVPAGPPTAGELNAVAVLSATDAWAVGYAGNIDRLATTLVEHWDGRRWRVVPSPNVPGNTQNELRDVAAVSPQDVWAVGHTGTRSVYQKGRAIAEHWDGSVWRMVPVPSPGVGGSLARLLTLSSSDVWAIGGLGDGRGTSLADHWDGVRWSEVAIPVGSSNGTIGVLGGSSPTDLFGVGTKTEGLRAVGKPTPLRRPGSISAWEVVSTPAHPVVVHSMGDGWAPQRSPEHPHLFALLDVGASGHGDVWILGSTETRGRPLRATVFFEHWNGVTWQTALDRRVAFRYRAWFGRLSVLSRKQAWAVSGTTSTLLWHWNGAGWHVVRMPFVDSAEDPMFGGAVGMLNGVAADSANDAWAVGASAEFGLRPRPLIEHWNGSTWSVTQDL